MTFSKDFIHSVFGINEFEWLIYETTNKEFAENKVRDFNEKCLINFTTERFNLYESSKNVKKFDKKFCKKLI